MDQNKTISTLEDEVVSEMERLNYAKETIRILRLNCRKFRDFTVTAQGNEFFSEEAGSQYLRETLNYPFDEKRPLTKTERDAVKCVRWLGEYNSFGGFTSIAPQKHAPVDEWGIADAKFIQAFIDGIHTADNKEGTKESRLLVLKGFYQFLAAHSLQGIAEIDLDVLSLYVQSLQGYATTTIKRRLALLRRYLHYVNNSGHVDTDWSYKIPVIRIAYNKSIPAIWTDEEIISMLKSFDRANPMGKRNYAILLLIVQLGLRISDVSSLTFDAFDWNENTLSFIQTKTGKANNSLPISGELGWAIIDYIQYGRPESDLPYVFLTGAAPYRQMKPHTVGDVIRIAMTKAGVTKRKLTTAGMHSLRHSLARRLLNEGVPLEEIASILGHRGYDSTRPYLSQDIDSLRKCCMSIGGDASEGK